MPNIYRFKDLSKPLQKQLLEYIASHFSKRGSYNRKVSAYGLKQHFTALVNSKDEHVTSKCFSEAMEASGYKSRLCGDEKGDDSNYEFNVYVLKHPRKLHK